MRFLLPAVLAVSVLFSSYSTPPAAALEARGLGRVAIEPTDDPRVLPSGELLSPRESGASGYSERLGALDDKVSNLKARCDALSVRSTFEADFEALKTLRAKVLVALTSLRDPMVGRASGEAAVEALLAQMERAVNVLGEKIDRLREPKTT